MIVVKVMLRWIVPGSFASRPTRPKAIALQQVRVNNARDDDFWLLPGGQPDRVLSAGGSVVDAIKALEFGGNRMRMGIFADIEDLRGRWACIRI